MWFGIRCTDDLLWAEKWSVECHKRQDINWSSHTLWVSLRRILLRGISHLDMIIAKPLLPLLLRNVSLVLCWSVSESIHPHSSSGFVWFGIKRRFQGTVLLGIQTWKWMLRFPLILHLVSSHLSYVVEETTTRLFYFFFYQVFSSWPFQSLKMKPPCCLETLGTSNALTRRHMPEERRK